MNHKNNIAKIANKLDAIAARPGTDFHLAKAAVMVALQFTKHWQGERIRLGDCEHIITWATRAANKANEIKNARNSARDRKNYKIADFVLSAAWAVSAGFDRDEITILSQWGAQVTR